MKGDLITVNLLPQGQKYFKLVFQSFFFLFIRNHLFKCKTVFIKIRNFFVNYKFQLELRFVLSLKITVFKRSKPIMYKRKSWNL